MKKNRKNKNAPPPGLPTEEKPPVKEQPKKQPFLKRLLFGEETPDLSELEAGSTTILDILSPTSVDTKSRDYIVVDGIFHAYLYITGYGYSTTVGASWLAPLVEAGEGVSISFHFDKQSKEKILAKISQQTMPYEVDERYSQKRRCSLIHLKCPPKKFRARILLYSRSEQMKGGAISGRR